jgi:alginate O-acetyltransferase complex protein AlgJ
MLTREQVISVYRQVLGRTPSEEEVDYQLTATSTLDGMLRIALDSEEYTERLREARPDSSRTQTVVNVFHPDLAAWGLPPGTRSEDGIAIVGHDGWLFLCGGTNANLGQYVGAVEMEPTWLEEWQEVARRRAVESSELGVATAMLVVPDKLAVYEEHYPEDLTRSGPRPIERLLAVPGMPLVYPLAELRAAAASGQEAYLRTDTHLTFSGNELLFSSVLAALEVESPPDFSTLPLRSYPIAGDLGVKFDPEIVSIVSEPNSLHNASIVEDNRDEIAAVDGHIGTRRVFRNEQAPDQRVAVVFGDSFGFSTPYYQGLAWFLAQVFREVHFIWVPFGWDSDYVRRVGAEAVLVQGAERFVARVPHLEVDVSRLAEETLRRKRPVGVEHVFD